MSLSNERLNKSVKCIIDPHIHLWNLSLKINTWLDEGTNEFLGNFESIVDDYFLNCFFRDAGSVPVEKCVHIQATNLDADYVRKETEWLTKIADADSRLLSIVSGADLLSKNVEHLLEYYQANKYVVGIRQILSDDNMIANSEWENKQTLLKKYNLSFDMQVLASQLPIAYNIVKNNPDVFYIMNHAGLPFLSHKIIWDKYMPLLSQLNNFALKISGFGMLNHTAWPYAHVKECVKKLLEWFDVSQLMFASNFPVEKLYFTYEEIYKVYFDLTADLSDAEKEALFKANALNIYGVNA